MEKGITLVTLIITLVVMLIIAGATIGISSNVIEKAEEKKLEEELTIVNNAIMEGYTNYLRTKNNRYLVGEKITDSQATEIANNIGITLVTIPTNIKEQDTNLSAYYRVIPTDLESIGIEDAQDSYIVNYLTGEVINETKANTGEKLYMYSRSNFDRTNDVTAF